MELAEIIRRTVRVLRAIDGRVGLDQLERASVDVLLFVAEAELAGEAPKMASAVEGSREEPEAAILRMEALERAGWLSFSGPTDGLSRSLHLSRHARRAFVATAAQLRRHSR